jgi:CDP-diglyceride synthetase
VDEVPDGPEDEVTRSQPTVARAEPTGPATGQVRIIGAEPAGEATAELPLVTRDEAPAAEDEVPPTPDPPALEPLPLVDGGFEQPSVRLTDEPGAAEGAADAVNPVSPGETAVPSGTPTELPHWTEPPTGQVPAVIARAPGEEGAPTGIAGPSWREEDSDWLAHDRVFEPGVLGDDDVPLGSLDETDRTDIERRPWEFDLDPAQSGQSHLVGRVPTDADTVLTGDPITEPVEVVRPTPAPPAEPTGARAADPGLPTGQRPPAAPPSAGGVAAAGAAAGAAGAARAREAAAEPPGASGSSLFPDEPGLPDEALLADDRPLPTGAARMGRARRSGLLPARLRAKRPEDIDDLTDAPLAAEPPGASVTEVPGAGRKKRGVAHLAAADRTAEREGEAQAVVTAAAAGAAATVRTADADADTEIGADRAVGTASGRRTLRRSHESRVSAPVPAAPPSRDAATGGGPPPPRPTGQPGDGAPRPGSNAASGAGLRVGTGVAAAVVALLAFKFGTVPSLVLVVIVVTFAAGECFSVLRRAGYHPATLLGLVGTISLTIGAYTKGIAALPLVLVLITAFTLIWYLFGIERGSPVAGTAATLLTVGWVSLMGAYAGLLLSPSTFPDRHGIAFLLGAIIATVANDVGALVVGGWLGRTPLAPKISPNKTWEGLFGGAVICIVVSTVAVGAIHPWSASHAALLGVVVAVVAPLGDLCESLLKRDLRLKDMGTLLPGHGGVLDRVDALLFVLPATYYLVRALNIA